MYRYRASKLEFLVAGRQHCAQCTIRSIVLVPPRRKKVGDAEKCPNFGSILFALSFFVETVRIGPPMSCGDSFNVMVRSYRR